MGLTPETNDWSSPSFTPFAIGPCSSEAEEIRGGPFLSRYSVTIDGAVIRDDLDPSRTRRLYSSRSRVQLDERTTYTCMSHIVAILRRKFFLFSFVSSVRFLTAGTVFVEQGVVQTMLRSVLRRFWRVDSFSQFSEFCLRRGQDDSMIDVAAERAVYQIYQSESSTIAGAIFKSHDHPDPIIRSTSGHTRHSVFERALLSLSPSVQRSFYRQ